MSWIVVTNWNEYQHPDVLRTKGPPAWIKLSTSIQHDQEFLELSFRRRAILISLLVEYGLCHGKLTNSPKMLSRRLSGNVTKQDIDVFVQAGFITLSASKPASNHASRVASLEKRREENPPTPLRGKPQTPSRNGRHEEPPMIDVITACQTFIEGRSWDETFSQEMIIEEFGRIERGRRTEGTIGTPELAGLLEQWEATRQDRYGTPDANLTP